ncbi:unnamed protein product, partial [Ectocarpus sp. 8 AP-2014]
SALYNILAGRPVDRSDRPLTGLHRGLLGPLRHSQGCVHCNLRTAVPMTTTEGGPRHLYQFGCWKALTRDRNSTNNRNHNSLNRLG